MLNQKHFRRPQVTFFHDDDPKQNTFFLDKTHSLKTRDYCFHPKRVSKNTKDRRTPPFLLGTGCIWVRDLALLFTPLGTITALCEFILMRWFCGLMCVVDCYAPDWQPVVSTFWNGTLSHEPWICAY